MNLIKLPYPPSLNRYYRTYKGRMLISEVGRKYRKAIQDLAWLGELPKYGSDNLKMTIHAWPPDHRKRDMDNLLKAVLDALQHAGVYDDDCQIYDLRIINRGLIAKGGSLQVDIEPMDKLGFAWIAGERT